MSSETWSSDSISGSISTTESITPGTSSDSNSGFINSTGDRDWYRIELRAGEQYEFLANAPNRGGAGTVLDPNLMLRNSQGTFLVGNNNFGGTLDSRFLFTATQTGTYYLDVSGANGSTGEYVVRAREVPGDASTYAQLSLGATRTGDLHAAGDHDWVAIQLVAGQSYNFQQLGSPTGGGTLADAFLFLRDSSGAIVAQDNDGGVGANSLINFLASKTGRYYLDASAFGSDTGNYELSAGSGFKETDATIEGTLGVWGSLSSSIQEAGDHDWYAIDLVAWETYVFQQRGSPSLGGTLADTFLTLRASTGTIVVQDDNKGLGSDSFIQFTATSSGTYYLDAGASGSNTGTYDLSARAWGDDAGGWYSIGTKVSLGISSGANGSDSDTGIISSQPDHDWYRIELRAGEQYEFLANAPNRGEGGTVLDVKQKLRDSEGIQLAANDNSLDTLDSRIRFFATQTGTYYLDVGGAFASTGAYVVRASEVPGDASTYAQLSVGATRTGDLHAAGDHDWVAVRLEAGQSYNFQQLGSATGSGTLADTFLFLRHWNGNILAQDNDSGEGANSLINFTASYSGRYYLDASAFGSDTGNYELPAGLGFAPTASNDLLV